MFILSLLLIIVILMFFLSVIYLILGTLLSKTKRLHRLGIWFIARSMLIPGKCIACKCHSDCKSTKCRNWNCANFYHCRDLK